MATWKKVILSGSQAHLQAVTASVSIDVPNAIGFYGTASWAQSASYALTAQSVLGSITSATSASVVQITDTTTGTGPYYLTFVEATSGHPVQRVDSNGMTYNATDNTLTLPGDIAVNGGDITTTATTFNLLTGATSTLNIGGATTTSSFGGQVIITGDLTVNGDTTYINTTQLLVEDQFILVASGSSNNSKDGGIVIDRGAYANQNTLFGYDKDTVRWGYQANIADAVTDITIGTNGNSAFAGIVFTEVAHSTKPTTGEFAVSGAIFIDNNADVWIYS